MHRKNINMSDTTIKIKGTDTGKVKIHQDERHGFTVILTISVSGNKLKPIIVSKGKTKRSLNKYELNNDVVGTFSNNGWANCGIIKIAIDQIYSYTKRNPATLLLDSFPAHKDAFILTESKKMNIKLLFIPEGFTYKYQLLDVSINGIIKQKSKNLWRKKVTQNPDIKITQKDAVLFFMECFDEIKNDVVINSFNLSCFINDKT